MKSLFKYVGIGILFISFGASAEKSVVDIKTWTTDNGVPVYFVQRSEVPMLDLQILFDAGSRRDDVFPGTAALSASLLNQGAGGHSADDIAEGFDSVGSLFSASVGRDTASFHVRSLTEPAALTSTLKLFNVVLTQPTFPQREIERLRKQTLQGMALRKQSASVQAVDLFYQNLYPEGPYRYPVSGTPSAIKAVKRDHLIAFYKTHYTVGSAKIVMVGDIDEARAKDIAKTLASGLPTGEAPVALTMPLTAPKASQINEKFSGPQTAIVLGQLGIARDNPHYYPLQVGNAVLGGLPFYSRLFTEVREKQGLTYSVHSGFSPMKQEGPFSIVLQTKNENATKAIRVTRETVSKFLLAGPSEVEMNIAKKNIEGRFPFAFASNASILSQVSRLAFYDLPLTYFDDYRENIKSVSQLQIQRAFQKTLQQDQWLLVQVGDV